jgi:hypothetical protein
MIKYFEFDSIDEYGQHIIPINPESPLTKLASPGYSPELMKVIIAMKRVPEYYYVVINALGSYEVWGSNRNGDAFPEKGLRHLSLRSDMGTDQDYGYKTFEYYAKLFKHHVNKDPKNSFGDIIFSHWNDKLKRVELIVGIDRVKGGDIIAALENGDNVSVSMGAKVKFDRCNICDNKSSTREAYCKHLKNYLRALVTDDLARQWSRETGKLILPGTVVFAINDFPRFFDISKVWIGADRTSYILGKAASRCAVISGIDMADSFGITDIMIDKLSAFGKKSEIDKELGGDALSNDKSKDGEIVAIPKSDALKKAIDATMQRTIAEEPRIPNSILDPIASTFPLNNIFSTLFGLGIHPKPVETQRIIIIAIKRPDIANYLDQNNMCFDSQEPVEQSADIDINDKLFNDVIARALMPYIEKRSAFPTFLDARMQKTLEKYAESNGIESVINNNDYWLQQGPGTGSLIQTSKLPVELAALGGLAAIYAGLKLKAAGYSPKRVAEIFINKPWLRNIIGGGVMVELMNRMIGNAARLDPYITRPANEYEDILQDTNFSGHIQKYASMANALGLGIGAGAVILPSAYMINSYSQKSLVPPKRTAAVGGTLTALGTLGYDEINKAITKAKRY